MRASKIFCHRIICFSTAIYVKYTLIGVDDLLIYYLVNYLVRSHQEQITPGETLRLGEHYVSVKKPILFRRVLLRPFLNAFTVDTETTSSLNAFHRETTLSEKKNFLMSKLLRFLASFKECPLVLLSLTCSNIESNLMPDIPLCILNSSMRSARFLRSSSVHRFSYAYRQYGAANSDRHP